MSDYQIRVDAREEYLVSQVFTAPPQKLQLLLIDAALKQTLRARDDYRAGEFAVGSEPILKAQEILTHIISTAKQAEEDNPLVKPIVALYTYMFRTLVNAYIEQSVPALDDVIRVLQEERETWLLVNDKLGQERGELRATDAQASSGFAFEA
jgi:flagellar secretion chaperone FliS